MSEWKTYRLGDLCSRIKSGKGIPASEVSTTGEYPVIGGNGIRGYTNTSNFNGVCAVVADKEHIAAMSDSSPEKHI